MKVIQPPAVQWLVILLQLKLGLIISRDLRGELGIIMNVNNHTVTWDTDTIPMKDRDTAIYHQ
jgi:hypothetical protein